MHKTKIDIPEELRNDIIELLNARLSDAIDLKTQSKQAHWNVKGMSFGSLHLLFDQIAADVDLYADDIAERAVQLGAQVHGTARVVAKKSSLKEYPLDITAGKDHVKAMSDALSTFGKSVREGIDKAEELQDQDTADLLTEISRGVDKWTWMVEAHLQ